MRRSGTALENAASAYHYFSGMALLDCVRNSDSLETLCGDRQIPVSHRDLPIPGERLI